MGYKKPLYHHKPINFANAVINGQICGESVMAMRVRQTHAKGNTEWLAKSQIKVVRRFKNVVLIEAPKWLLRKKGFFVHGPETAL